VSLPNSRTGPAAEALIATYRSDSRAHRIDKRFLPSRDEIVDIVESVLELLYPGYWGRTNVASKELARHIERSVESLRTRLSQQIELCVLHREEVKGRTLDETMQWAQVATRIADAFIDALPGIRRTLIGDVQAAFDGDPAARSLDEVILAYPGVLAVSVYRIAHQLHVLGVPLMPRVMSEWAHARTGADLHPGATIGQSFFIDHATGVVIGETAILGDRVKLYQGVTLGALSVPHEAGRRSPRRHPTVEDGVTVYANATILGGETVIGAGSIIAAGSFVTRSVLPGSTVGAEVEHHAQSPSE
jgi:serine O-acetyltransferase